jgi:uncharacterized protein with HEPN domain
MPPRDLRMYLVDILEAADRIARYTEGKTLDQFRTEEGTRMIVERSFEIIGEALRQAADAHPVVRERVTDVRLIVAFRNTLIHAYHQIDPTIVWDASQNHLPLLRREIAALLDEESKGR